MSGTNTLGSGTSNTPKENQGSIYEKVDKVFEVLGPNPPEEVEIAAVMGAIAITEDEKLKTYLNSLIGLDQNGLPKNKGSIQLKPSAIHKISKIGELIITKNTSKKIEKILKLKSYKDSKIIKKYDLENFFQNTICDFCGGNHKTSLCPKRNKEKDLKLKLICKYCGGDHESWECPEKSSHK